MSFKQLKRINEYGFELKAIKHFSQVFISSRQQESFFGYVNKHYCNHPFVK